MMKPKIEGPLVFGDPTQIRLIRESEREAERAEEIKSWPTCRECEGFGICTRCQQECPHCDGIGKAAGK